MFFTFPIDSEVGNFSAIPSNKIQSACTIEAASHDDHMTI